jgi:hypothetical protein
LAVAVVSTPRTAGASAPKRDANRYYDRQQEAGGSVPVMTHERALPSSLAHTFREGPVKKPPDRLRPMDRLKWLRSVKRLRPRKVCG